MKTKLREAMFLLFTAVTLAQTFTVDNINYSVTSTTPNEVQVSETAVLDDLVIPEIAVAITIAAKVFLHGTGLNPLAGEEDLMRDGDIVGLDGISPITFTEESGDYFIAIKHRNHIGILTAVPALLSSTTSTLDFTQDAAFAKGGNLALTTLVNGTFAMIAGDADGSSQILNTDITEALGLAGGGQAYSTADADMNGFVLNSDIQLLVLGNSGTVQQFE